MTIRVAESGKPFRYKTAVDMSAYTDLRLTFTKPDGSTQFVRTHATNPSVYLGPKIVDEDLGVLNANEYMEYTFQQSDFDTPGTWSVQGKYTNSAVEPDDIFIGPDVEFEVLE